MASAVPGGGVVTDMVKGSAHPVSGVYVPLWLLAPTATFMMSGIGLETILPVATIDVEEK